MKVNKYKQTDACLAGQRVTHRRGCRPLMGLLALLAVVLPLPAAAQFLPLFNQGALQRSAALPVLGATQVATAPGWQAALDLTTEYSTQMNATESVLQDGESARVALRYRAALAEDLEWNLEVPVLVLGGGFMDRLIEDWHGWFGLPNGGRELAPRDRYRYQYVRNGVTLLDVTDSGTHLGDVRAGLGWHSGAATVLRAELKLPTGDGAALAGGNAGLALWLDHALDFGAGSRWSGYLSAGGSAIDTPEVLAELQERAAGFGGLGLGYRVGRGFSIVSQLYVHSALFRDTALDSLKKPGLQFALGASWRLPSGTRVQLAFQEDPVVSSSPDFSLHFGYAFE